MDHVNMEHDGHGGHDHGHTGHGMEMSMPMIFSLSTKVTILFSWWSTTTVISYVLTLLLLFLLACFNRFLGILKLLHQRPNDLYHEIHDVPNLTLPLSRWTRNPNANDRMSPLPPQVVFNDNDTDRYDAFPTAPLLGPTSQPYSNQYDESSQPSSYRSHRKLNWQHDGTSSLLEGLRALIGYGLMLAVMTFNVGVLCAVIVGMVVGELFLGRFSPPSPGWQDGACHNS
ncbi:copper transporter crmD [Penicillium odoratum]|uniref:copper transporter crmD n=1 Tax=Penicillium odoratum TaxID=1167516 RepID=UPI0025499333|nr:copper transporter crmD [Penicillium odoratum]KAJ5758449.1 copper transporter crmD [Penicillium odoratum]